MGANPRKKNKDQTSPKLKRVKIEIMLLRASRRDMEQHIKRRSFNSCTVRHTNNYSGAESLGFDGSNNRSPSNTGNIADNL